MKIVGIIPSRYASSRLPGKPLADIGGKPMIQRVYEQAQQAMVLTNLLVATDDERIRQAVAAFGGNAVITSGQCTNGTERCAQAILELSLSANDVVVNIQGDEPFIPKEHIELLAACFQRPEVQIATLIKTCKREDEWQNPARIKVVVDKQLKALYFSRSTIPYWRNGTQPTNQPQAEPVYYKHIGIYGYRVSVLKEIAALKPTALEQAECLEQLRWLENGYQIQCAVTMQDSLSVDVPEDLENARQLIAQKDRNH